MNDHDYVNFSQEHELNYILRKFGKRQTDANRKKLEHLGGYVKQLTGKPRLTHGDFHPHVQQQSHTFE